MEELLVLIAFLCILSYPVHIIQLVDDSFFIGIKYWKEHNWIIKIFIILINITCMPVLLIDAILYSFILIFMNLKNK